MLTLVKLGTIDEFSLGDFLDPIINSATLDDTGTPPTVISDVIQCQLLAENYLYEDIGMSFNSELPAINYELSLNNSNWHDTLTGGLIDDPVNGVIGHMDASGGEVRTEIYVRVVADNTGLVSLEKITAISQAVQAIVTVEDVSGFIVGDKVYIKSVNGMIEVNDKAYLVGTILADTFELMDLDNQPIDSSAYGAYTSSGKVLKVNTVLVLDAVEIL